MGVKEQLEEYLRYEKDSADAYLAAYVDFIKWTTTIAVAAVLWVSTALGALAGIPRYIAIASLVFLVLALLLAVLAFKRGIDRSAHFWDIARLNWSRALLDAFEKAGADAEFVSRKRKELTGRFDSLSSVGEKLTGSAHFQRTAMWHVITLSIGAALYGLAQVWSTLSA